MYRILTLTQCTPILTPSEKAKVQSKASKDQPPPVVVPEVPRPVLKPTWLNETPPKYLLGEVISHPCTRTHNLRCSKYTLYAPSKHTL